MARFHSPDAFRAPEAAVQLLPFRFERLPDGKFLISNMVGDFARLDRDELDRLVELRLAPGDGLYERAYSQHLIMRQDQRAQLQILALRLLSRLSPYGFAVKTKQFHRYD